MSAAVMPIQTRHIKDRVLRELCPTEVPWALVAPHEQQCKENHYQTLARIAERQGFSAAELYYVLRDETFPHFGGRVDDRTAIAFINQQLAELRSAAPAGDARGAVSE